MGLARARWRCLAVLWAARGVLAGPSDARLLGRALPSELLLGLEEPGDQLVIDGDTGGLAYVKVRPLPQDAGPFLWDSSSGEGDGAPASPSSSSWEPWPQGAGAAPAPSAALPAALAPAPVPVPAPSPGPGTEEPQEEPAGEEPAKQELTPEALLEIVKAHHPDPKPYFKNLKPREGWPPLHFEEKDDWESRQHQIPFELALYPLNVVYHEDKARKAAAYTGEHYWPSSRGGVTGEGGVSQHTAPLATPENLAWTYHNKFDKWATILSGVSIDDKLNIYLTAFDGVRKFDITGKMLWEYYSMPSFAVDTPSLYKGGLYGCLCTGEAFALDIEDGKLIWLTKVSYAISQDNGFVQVNQDVVVLAADAMVGSGQYSVYGLSAPDGKQLWKFSPDRPSWNFGAGFPDDGTVLFQDFEGRGYRLRLEDGSLLWKAGGEEGTWTDGSATLGPDGVFYTVRVGAAMGQMRLHTPGTLTALRVEDGSEIWRARVPEPPNNAPAIGPLEPGGPNCVVLPLGCQCEPDMPTYIHVFAAKDGSLLYKFCGPKLQYREPFHTTFQAADPQGWKTRVEYGCREMSAPNPWSAPSIGGDGTFYCGNQDGQFYSIRTTSKPAANSFKYNGNWHGVVSGGKDKALEVWAFDCFACFGGPAGAAIAPGVLVVGTIYTIFVFLDPSLTGQGSGASAAEGAP